MSTKSTIRIEQGDNPQVLADNCSIDVSNTSQRKLQRIMGHADIRTTMIYLHLANEYITDDHEMHSSLTPMG